MDRDLINTTGDMLQAGLNFTLQESADGKVLPPILLMGKDSTGKPGSSAHAEFAYHFQDFDAAMQNLTVKWQDIVTQTEGNPLQGDMLTAYLQKPEWEADLRKAYEGSTILKNILSDSAKAPKLIADKHLTELTEFRTKSESLLGIEQGRAQGTT